MQTVSKTKLYIVDIAFCLFEFILKGSYNEKSFNLEAWIQISYAKVNYQRFLYLYKSDILNCGQRMNSKFCFNLNLTLCENIQITPHLKWVYYYRYTYILFKMAGTIQNEVRGNTNYPYRKLNLPIFSCWTNSNKYV